MDITVHHKTETTTNREKGQDSKRKSKKKVDRRKASRDRRNVVNDAVVVRLSIYPRDRRARLDRRQSFVPPHITGSEPQQSESVFVDTIA